MKAILWLCSLILIAAYVTGPLVDPDLWWHLTSGRWMLAHGEIPRVDYWNMFGVGKPWRAYSWSNELVLALVDHLFGARGLIALKLFLALGIVGSLSYCFSRIANDYFVGLLLGVFAAVSAYNHFTLRPQSFTWILFVLAIYQGHRALRDGLTRSVAITTVLIFALWANSHITTPIGLFAIGSWAFDRERKLVAVKMVGLAFLGTLITPYFGGEWLTFFSKSGHPFAFSSIGEFQPATILQYPTGFLILATVLVAIAWIKGGTPPPPARCAAAGGLIIAGLAVVKFLPLASIYVCAICASQWGALRAIEPRLHLVEAIERLRRFAYSIPEAGASFVILSLAAVLAQSPWMVPVSRRVIPVEAVDFMQKFNLPHPILNEFGRGGYLMYRYSDSQGRLEHLVPIDGRTNVMSPEAWQAEQAAEFGKHNWRDYITLVQPKTILWRTESPFVPILIATKEWCRVFKSGSESEGFSVLISRSEFERLQLPSDNCSL